MHIFIFYFGDDGVMNAVNAQRMNECLYILFSRNFKHRQMK